MWVADQQGARELIQDTGKPKLATMSAHNPSGVAAELVDAVAGLTVTSCIQVDCTCCCGA